MKAPSTDSRHLGEEGMRLPAILRRLGKGALGLSPIRRAALALGSARTNGLALVFHRIPPQEERPGIVSAVARDLFRRQVEALLELGEVVPLLALTDPPTDRRGPRFALTFDDDHATHTEQALPVLQELGVTATFFLSGRSLHGLGPPWFDVLDAIVRTVGANEAARRLGLDIEDAATLALACERDIRLQDAIPADGIDVSPQLSVDSIRALAEAGMTIGFHTLHHPVLPRLDDATLARAVVEGRDELETLIGEPVRLFAYPHGKADPRVVQEVRRAGYVAAWTGRPYPMSDGADPHLLGRWEPGPLPPDRLVTGVAIRLNRQDRGR